MNNTKKPLALAFSGGGIRAMIFHMGVLRELAERKLLEDVTHVSTVSGGSLLIGLIFHINQMKWPTSEEYLDRVLPTLEASLCQRSLQWGAFKQLLSVNNWRFWFSRANALAEALVADWGITYSLKDLPIYPEWSINGTAAETGKRFRFKRSGMGDYSFGYSDDTTSVRLADAMAVSAAFPVGFGPLTLVTTSFKWKKRKSWGDNHPEEDIQPEYEKLHLYDGGIYDNLGIEPFLDVGTGMIKNGLPGNLRLIVSDAGAPLVNREPSSAWHILQIKRLADIVTDQTRALRVRCLYRFMREHPEQASYVYIANPDLLKAEKELGDATFASTYFTTLKCPKRNDFLRILTHGQCCAKAGILDGF